MSKLLIMRILTCPPKRQNFGIFCSYCSFCSSFPVFFFIIIVFLTSFWVGMGQRRVQMGSLIISEQQQSYSGLLSPGQSYSESTYEMTPGLKPFMPLVAY